MKSRAFLISIILITNILNLFACGPSEYIDPRRHWIFFTGYGCADKEWQQKQNKLFREENITFWHEYVKKAVPRETVEEALYDVYLLNSHTTNAFFRYLIDHKDTTALHYWMRLKSSDSAYVTQQLWEQSAWYFGPKERELLYYWVEDSNNPTYDLSISEVETLSENCLLACKKPQIRNRYLLQLMRKCFYWKDYEKCIDLWEKNGKNVPESALRTQCLNYYGGALRRIDRDAEAAIAYAQIGYFDPRLHYNVEVLREIYRQNPKCAEFEFLVQQFVNAYFDKPTRAKSVAFNKLAEEVLREGKSVNPALWKSAQAAIAYIDKQPESAMKLLDAAGKLRGTAAVKDNIRMMRLVFNTSRTDLEANYEATIYPDLQWLVNTIKSEDKEGWDGIYEYGWEDLYQAPSASLHHIKILRRAILIGIVPHFERLGMFYKSIAYMNLYDELMCWFPDERDLCRKGLVRESPGGRGWNQFVHPPIYYTMEIDNYYAPHDYGKKPVTVTYGDSVGWRLSYDYHTQFFYMMDTTNVANVLKYVAFLKSGGNTQAEKFLLKNSYKELSYYYELIGTKYMREEKYDSALTYLRKVSPKFLKMQNIAEYLNAGRNPFKEQWISKKSLKGDFSLPFDPAKAYDENPGKIAFCEQMLKLKRLMNTDKSATTRARATYAYAMALHQSTFGHAWALSTYENGWNGGWAGYVESYEEQFKREKPIAKRIDRLLDEALKQNKDELFSMKCKIIHSLRQKELKVKVTHRYGDYTTTEEVFNKKVTDTFCDLGKDYEDPSIAWRQSAWYY